MSDPEAREEDELEIDAETVRDLEPSESDSDEVRGGRNEAGEAGFLSSIGGSCKC